MSKEFRNALVVLLGVCAACNQHAAEQQIGADTTKAHAPASPPVQPAATKADSIRIEGMWQPITLQLVRPSSSIPFLTYMPSDMIAESKSSDKGEAHFFYANFGGKRNDEAYLLIFMLPAGTDEAQAVAAVREFKASQQRTGFIVTADLRRHGARYYYIVEHYPAEYGDGFGPRSHLIQEQWKWLD